MTYQSGDTVTVAVELQFELGTELPTVTSDQLVEMLLEHKDFLKSTIYTGRINPNTSADDHDTDLLLEKMTVEAK